jgi:transglutaminase-like putative cysteine protease
MEPEARRKLGIGMFAAGVALAIAGAWLYRRNRRQLGDGVSLTRSGGMTLKHYRGALPIKKRVALLQDLVWQSVQDPKMRKLALQITKGCPARDGECEARAIYNWVKRNIRYTGDVAPVKMGSKGPVEGVDLYQTAARTVEFGGGDCDDHVGLAATLLTLNGIPAKFRITAPMGMGDDWSHIFGLAGLPKTNPATWRALDTTLPHGQFGTEAAYGRKLDFPA